MIRATLRRLSGNQRGTALIEFAVSAPVLILLFLGGYQIADASACKRKSTVVARAIADMVSQYTIISPNELDTLLAASTQIMSPYSTDDAQVRVSLLTVNNKEKAKVTWSRGFNIAARKKGATVNINDNLENTTEVYVYAEITYNYDRHLGSFAPPMKFTQTLIMLPRKSSTITCTDC